MTTTVTQAFTERMNEARKILAILTERVDDSASDLSDDLNWADVGDAGRLVESLRQIIETHKI